MHTFVIRVFEANDLDRFMGVVEEPLTGLRRPFDGPDDLVTCLVLAARRPIGSRRGSSAPSRIPRTRTSSPQEAAMHRFVRSIAASAVLALGLAVPASAAAPETIWIPAVEFDDPSCAAAIR